MGEMTTEDRGQLSVTAAAAARLAELIAQEGDPKEGGRDLMLRLAVSGGGCSGFQYGFSFDDTVNGDDRVFERDGVKVVVDEVSLDLLGGSELDYVEELGSAAFKIRNPQATSSCGCGSSFSVGAGLLRLATWNVNSIKARLPAVLDWLKTSQPDLLVMQEIKCETAAFPALEFEALGYKTAAVGQKSYNGVAVAARLPFELTAEALPGDPEDTQARYIEVTCQDLTVAGLYLPNGNPAPGPKYDYKLAWMARLEAHAAKLLASERPVALGGDYNVIPQAEDCYDPAAWADDALFRPDTRRAFRRLLNLGFTEAFAALDGRPGVYSFWDYQGGAWQHDQGIRIDHWLLSPQAADRLRACEIDKAPRAKPKASDHTPVLVTLEDA